MQELNANVRQQDVQDPLKSGRPRQKRRSEWEIKAEVMRRGEGKGGVDWYRYCEEVQRVLLYPFAKQAKDQNSEKGVWIVEDNAGPHGPASASTILERMEIRVKKTHWPPNSPDLNMIEPARGYLKDTVPARQPSVPVSVQMTAAKSAFREEWHSMAQNYINNLCDSFQN